MLAENINCNTVTSNTVPDRGISLPFYYLFLPQSVPKVVFETPNNQRVTEV